MTLAVRYLALVSAILATGCAQYQAPPTDSPAARIRLVVGPWAGGRAAVIKKGCTPSTEMGWDSNTENLGEMGYRSFSQKYIRESIGMPEPKFPEDYSYIERSIAAGSSINVGIYSDVFRRYCSIGFAFTPLSGHDYEIVFTRPQGSSLCQMTLKEIQTTKDGATIRTSVPGSSQLPSC